MIDPAKKRALVACSGLSVLFLIFAGRLVYLQVYKHDHYAAIAADKHVKKQIIQARRGEIHDVNGEVVADNEPLRTVIADGSRVPKPKIAKMAEILAEPLGLKKEELEKKLASTNRYMVLKKKVPANVATSIEEKLRAAGCRGIDFEFSSGRVYPNGPMLAHLVGFVDGTYKGVQGIEKSLEHLRGTDGYRFTERDPSGNEIILYRGQERAARNGSRVQLTVDMGIQGIVESELDAAMAQFRPKGAVAIMMRPKTGEILAMASRPNFDPNAIGSSPAAFMNNPAIMNMVEPGSTFKIVTTAAALNEGVASLDSMIFCENGLYSYGGRTLKDHHGYGELSVRRILAVSSNIGFAKIAMRLGDQRLYEYVRRFGFGERTGVKLPGEINGLVHPPHQWSKISITRLPMGQEVGVTPLQMITAVSAIANGGALMMPQVVREVVDESGATTVDFQPIKVRQVVSPKTAALVRDALRDVVGEGGTARQAKVAGFSVAGKTGTAQKADPKGGYMKNKYIVSFVGFLPAEDPEFACLVMVDEASASEEQNYGGLVAAPVFSRIAERTARYMNLEPTEEPVPGQLVLNGGR